MSDAERAEVTDALKRHCADGRLDVSEFEQRVHIALSAKTRADLGGLMTDLPTLYPEAPSSRRRPRVLSVVLAVIVVIGLATTASWLFTSHMSWVVLVLIVLWVWRRPHHRRLRRRSGAYDARR